MNNLQIIYATQDVAGFIVDNELYFLKFGPNIPELFNSSMARLTIPNMDSWIQAKTHQRYSYLSLRDAATAFYQGLSSAYTTDDINNICGVVVRHTLDKVLKCGLIYEYILVYWIEAMGSNELEECLRKISSNFHMIRTTIGDDKLYNNLCRIHKMCKKYQPHSADVCEKLIRRLGRESYEPIYPATADVDQQVLSCVKEAMWQSLGTYYKNIPNKIVNVMHALQAKV